jgi:hypothetical protein
MLSGDCVLVSPNNWGVRVLCIATMPTAAALPVPSLRVRQVWGAMPGQSHASVPEVGQKRLPVQEQLQGMATLRFAYTRNAIFLPSQQPGQLVFVDVVLSQLPQGASPAELAAASASGMLPPQAWTFLFWAVNRCAGVTRVSLIWLALSLHFKVQQQLVLQSGSKADTSHRLSQLAVLAARWSMACLVWEVCSGSRPRRLLLPGTCSVYNPPEI